jgi:hypothetical protein
MTRRLHPPRVPGGAPAPLVYDVAADNLNDIYSFDPDTAVEFDEFEDLVGRNFRQPSEGLGFDGSPVAHMWRTMIWPNNFL